MKKKVVKKETKELSLERCVYCGLTEIYHVEPRYGWAKGHEYQINRRKKVA